MIKLPNSKSGQWRVTHSSDKIPDLSVTKNLTFDKEGYLRLSKPVVSFYSEADDVDFDIPIRFQPSGAGGQYKVLTNEAVFNLDMYQSGAYGNLTVAQDTDTDSPENTSTTAYADAVWFNDRMVYANPTDRKMYVHPGGALTGNSWTIHDTSASLNTSTTLTTCHFLSQKGLCVGNRNYVDMFNTSYALDTELLLPDDYRVTGIAYNNNYVGITTHHSSNASNSAFFVWDGNGTSANYVAEVPTVTCYNPIPYKGTFVFLDGNGVFQYWTPTGLVPLIALPANYVDATFSSGQTANNLNHSIQSDGELIHINLKSTTSSSSEFNDFYNHMQPGGIWTYDPAVGLYNRHTPTGTKVVVDTIATSAVNTSTDAITVASAPETGTPVRYSDGTSTAITGLTNKQVYYTIKVDGTTVKLAETYTDALAGTQIDLTGTGNNAQTLQFYLKTDFGQSYLSTKQGCLFIEPTKSSSADLYYQTFFYGAKCAIDTTTQYAVGGFALQDTENRGYFITSKLLSSGLKDDWQKLYIKHSELSSDLDKIVIKYRTDNNEPLTRIKETTDGVITWTDSDTFTTTDTQWSAVETAVNTNSEDVEVEIIQGTGSGYLAHISSISEAGGTYTVNLDEGVKNLTASRTGRAIASKWNKLTTIINSNPRNSDGYSEIPIGKKSKQIQFKIELRGEDVEVEEILVANQLSKTA